MANKAVPDTEPNALHKSVKRQSLTQLCRFFVSARRVPPGNQRGMTDFSRIPANEDAAWRIQDLAADISIFAPAPDRLISALRSLEKVDLPPRIQDEFAEKTIVE